MIIDVNVNLSRWPSRRLHGDEPDELVKMLELACKGITTLLQEQARALST